jgi:elongation factor Ts
MVNQGVVVGYTHNAVADNMGKIGVLVALESSADVTKLASLGKQIAMHIAAAKPESVSVNELDPALIEREKNIFTEQARASGKPDSIIEKMVEGRIRKYYEEAVLLEQVFVIDGSTKISDVVAQAEKELGSSIKISGFARFTLGEGIEQEHKNFADEVAAMTK